MKLNKYLSSALIGSALLATSVGFADDPRITTLNYYGSGYTERPYDYAEVWFDFSVNCKTSAEDVRKSIEAQSASVWATIAQKVDEKTYTETDRRFWGPIGGISGQPSAQLNSPDSTQVPVVLNGQTTQQTLPGDRQLVDVCSKQVVPFGTKIGTIYSGAQRFGVRSSDLDWIEALVRTVNALPQSTAKDAVSVSAEGIQYSVTKAHTEEDKRTVVAQAEAQALGTSSDYANDVTNLKLAHAFYKGRTPVYSIPRIEAPVGNPVSDGQAPKVTVKLPFTYTIYAEGQDLQDKTNTTDHVGISTEYDVQGTAETTADYAKATIEMKTQCQATKDAALKALEPEADDVSLRLHALQGTHSASETDKLDLGEAAAPTLYYPYEAVSYKLDKNGNAQPATYLNDCTGTSVAAPADGDTSELQGYYQIDRVFSVKSSDFAAIQTLLQDLQKQYAVSNTAVDRTDVIVSDATGQVTEDHKAQLAIQARANATACVVDPNGQVAKDSAQHHFQCAYLKDFHQGNNQPMYAAASLAEAAPMAPRSMERAAGQTDKDGLVVQVVKKAGSDRAWYSTRGQFSFEFQVESENYLQYFDNQSPAPASPSNPAVSSQPSTVTPTQAAEESDVVHSWPQVGTLAPQPASPASTTTAKTVASTVAPTKWASVQKLP